MPIAVSDVMGRGADSAYFCFDYPPDRETFTFELTDPDRIEEARQILSGEARPRHVMGTIIKTPVEYNPPWSFHLEPKSIIFFDAAIEICDATITTVEENLADVCDAFLPGCTWCPWGSRLIAEISPPEACPRMEQSQRIYLPLLIQDGF